VTSLPWTPLPVPLPVNHASQSLACLQMPLCTESMDHSDREKLNFEQKIVDLQNKSKHFKELYASIHPDPTAPAKVPIIIGESASASRSLTTAIRHLYPV